MAKSVLSLPQVHEEGQSANTEASVFVNKDPVQYPDQGLTEAALPCYSSPYESDTNASPSERWWVNGLNELCKTDASAPARFDYGSVVLGDYSSEKYLEQNASELTDNDDFHARKVLVIAPHVAVLCDTDRDEDVRLKWNKLNEYINSNQIHIRDETGFIKCHSASLKFVDLYPTDLPAVRCVVSINTDYKASIYVHRKLVSETHRIWSALDLKRFDSCDSITNLLRAISSYDVCCGNPDEEFSQLSAGLYYDIETYSGAKNGAMIYDRTFRSHGCYLLVEGLRCRECIKQRGSLRSRRLRKSKPRNPHIGVSSPMANSAMSTEQLINKLNELQKIKRSQDNKIGRLKKQLAKANGDIYQSLGEDIDECNASEPVTEIKHCGKRPYSLSH